MRGQGATDYLLLVAVVLLIGIVVASLVALAGTGGLPNARKLQSDAYWRAMRPISIIDGNIDSNGDLSLILRNQETDSATLLEMAFGENPPLAISQVLVHGQDSELTIPAPAVEGAGGYCTYTSVSMNYRLGELELRETGASLVVKCQGGVCYPQGTACLVSRNCCSGLSCVGTEWGESSCFPSSQCRPLGYECVNDPDCCSGLLCVYQGQTGYCAFDMPP